MYYNSSFTYYWYIELINKVECPRSKEEDRLDGWISFHHVLVINYHKCCIFLVFSSTIWRAPPFYLHPPLWSRNIKQQMCLYAKMHAIVFSLLFMHYVSYLYLRILLFDQYAFVWVVYLSLLGYVVLLYPIFGAIVFHIHPEFILKSKHFHYLDLMLRLF